MPFGPGMPLSTALRPKRKQVKMAVSFIQLSIKNLSNSRPDSVLIVPLHANAATRVVHVSGVANTASQTHARTVHARNVRKVSREGLTNEREKLILKITTKVRGPILLSWNSLRLALQVFRAIKHNKVLILFMTSICFKLNELFIRILPPLFLPPWSCCAWPRWTTSSASSAY